MQKVLTKYKNGNYNVILLEDGTKIRYNSLDSLVPSFAESIDCSITTKCDGGCNFCYLNCTEQGKHADLNQEFFTTLHAGQELAINGNDLSHPDLTNFLIRLKNQKVICNLTVNQKHFIREIDKLRYYRDNNLIYGLGISLTNSKDKQLFTYIKEFPNAVLHTINGILTAEDISNLKNKHIKLLILGYKHLGRGNTYYEKNKDEINNNISYIQKNIFRLQKYFEVISFDNLAIEQLDIKRKLDSNLWKTLYMGDEGKFTFYISAVDKTFAKSSLELEYNYDILDKSVDEMFNYIRKEEI